MTCPKAGVHLFSGAIVCSKDFDTETNESDTKRPKLEVSNSKCSLKDFDTETSESETKRPKLEVSSTKCSL